jgi:hypothetical protein
VRRILACWKLTEPGFYCWVQLSFELEGHTLTVNVVVTEVLDELVIGIDWQTANNYPWDFGKARVLFNNFEIQVHSRPSPPSIRRLYVAEERVTLARHQAIIPLKLTLDGSHMPRMDWFTES